MHKYALIKPSSYYLSQFHEESIKIKPGLYRQHGKSPNGEQHGSLHTNGSENDIRSQITRREISGGTQRSRQLP
jgi:hypothetical protein